ncbi:MAG: hypothetical protein M1833_004699 [Piccolia ochrophora]|nr:MAG: hypothetical protein M1833_004699 [Piccolia ochrophora]
MSSSKEALLELSHTSEKAKWPIRPESDTGSVHSPAGGGPSPCKRRKLQHPSPQQSPPLIGGQGFRETPSIASAKDWFEDSNNNVQTSVNSSFIDSDPPFYIEPPASPDDQYSVCAVPSERNLPSTSENIWVGGTLNKQTFDHGESDIDDFRSVIDDLTVENKRLRRRLIRYERLRLAELRNERVCEITVHGLAVEKKRELEDFIQRLTSDPGNEPVSQGPSRAPQTRSIQTDNPRRLSVPHKRPADSAYASNSVSGLTAAIDGKEKRSPSDSNDEQVESYLHDIPPGLFPRGAMMMTEEAKQYLVVDRLQHLFIGRASRGEEHSHPLQQQEVSDSAAQADRSAREATGQIVGVEGARESRIVPANTDTAARLFDLNLFNTSQSKHGLNDGQPPVNFASAECLQDRHPSPDQRPARPLDLDPDRAQNADEALDYLRHLGLPSPAETIAPGKAQNVEWFYLNLLMNLAQLHTINVTPDFVREAIKKVGQKFELSKDGRKVRWNGGSEKTRPSSEGLADPDDVVWAHEYHAFDKLETNHPSRKIGAGHNANWSLRHRDDSSNAALSATSRGIIGAVYCERKMSNVSFGRNIAGDKFQYKPVLLPKAYANDGFSNFSHHHSSSPTATSPGKLTKLDATSWSCARDSTLTTSLPSQCRQAKDGPIIFYRHAEFFTDLSGDQLKYSRLPSSAFSYQRLTTTELGQPPSALMARPVNWQHHRRAALRYYDCRDSLDDPDLASSDVCMTLDCQFPSVLHGHPVSRAAEDFSSIDFDVSGIGGVCPSDNFSFKVQKAFPRYPDTRLSLEQLPLVDTETKDDTQELPFHRESNRSDLQKGKSVLGAVGPQRSVRPIERSKVVSAVRVDLTPTPLPPPSCLLPLCIDCDEDGEFCGGGIEIGSIENTVGQNVHRHKCMQFGAREVAGSVASHAASYTESESDVSMDLLASAKQSDPDAIAEQEREFERGLSPEMAEQLLVGSSAATGGYGSASSSDVSSPPAFVVLSDT